MAKNLLQLAPHLSDLDRAWLYFLNDRSQYQERGFFYPKRVPTSAEVGLLDAKKILAEMPKYLFGLKNFPELCSLKEKLEAYLAEESSSNPA